MDAARPPIVSLELLLDPALEEAVRAEWETLAGAGMSSLGRFTSPSNRPHVTLLVRGELDTPDVTGVLRDGPVPLTLSGPVLLGTGDRRVLARVVVPTARLIGLHDLLHRLAGPGADAAHTAPGAWTPHVTLARRLRIADAPAALARVSGELHGAAAGLRRWDAASATVTDLGAFAEAGSLSDDGR